MKKTRENLQLMLEDILGSEFVYFQPPENVKLSYPCIIYDLDGDDKVRADNKVYLWSMRYQVTVISKDPDADYWKEMVKRFDHCTLDRTSKVDNLNHWYLTLFW